MGEDNGATVSADRVKIMILAGLEKYEREVVEPRHRETQSTLALQTAILNKIRGGVILLGGIGGCAGTVWTIMEIHKAVTH